MWDATITSLMKAYAQFLVSPVRNRYIEDEHEMISVYVRRGIHLIDGGVQLTTDIANISVNEDVRGMGLGGEVINTIHSSNPFSVTYIECILNEQLYEHLKRNGWQDVKESNPPSLFKYTEQTHAS